VSESELVFNLQCLQRRTARKKFRKDILDAWDNTCAYCCSDRAYTLDHIIPRAKGGPTKRGNLLACCPTCNLQKSDECWLMWYRSQTFWSEERELIIWNWLSYNHEKSIAAREYEEACREPLKLSTSSPEQQQSAFNESGEDAS
jgi:hypothetical protein